MAEVTLRHVAAAAGVSVSTVSKIVSGHAERTRIHPATQQRVLDAVEQLGYVPNQPARSLRARRTGQIGLALSGLPLHDLAFMHWNEGALLTGLSLAAREHRLPAIVIYPQIDPEPQSDPALFMDGRIDGLLVRSVLQSEHRLLDLLDPARLPVVVVWGQRVPDGMGFADVDHHQGATLAIEHLLALGHRRIAYADTGERDYNPHFALRYQGYRDALTAAGAAAHPECAAADLTGVLALLEGTDPITAIFVPQDFHAAAIVEGLRAHGVRVPEDVSVIGFDDYETASRTAGGLTTIRQPMPEMMMQAVRNLLALMEGAPADQCRSLVPTSLVVRNTTAPPRRARPGQRAGPARGGH